MFKLVTSNQNKLKEFQRYGIQNLIIEPGKDLKEVQADSQTVIVYKSLEAGKNHIVEDTSLHVENEDVGANIRYLLDDLKKYNGKKAVWEVLIGLNDGETISIYQGVIEGTITDKFKNQNLGFGFDAYFIPNGTNNTLYELELNEKKDNYSARKKCVDNYLENKILKKISIKDIPVWEGLYQ